MFRRHASILLRVGFEREHAAAEVADARGEPDRRITARAADLEHLAVGLRRDEREEEAAGRLRHRARAHRCRQSLLALCRVLGARAARGRRAPYRRALVRVAIWSSPRHISSVVPSPQRTYGRSASATTAARTSCRSGSSRGRVAGIRVDGMLEVVRVLPVEVPVRDVQQRLRAWRPRIELDADVDTAEVHVPGDAVDAHVAG